MRRAALSYDTLLADVYWIRALQHYGGERLKPDQERRYDLLYPLLDLATTLDPRFYGRVSVRRHLSGRAAPGWSRAARSGDRAAEEGDRVRPGQVGLLPRHRLHLLLEPSRLSECGRVVRARRRSAGRAVVAEDVRGGHADARRRSSGVARDVEADRPERGERVAAPDVADCGWRSSTRSIRSTSLQRVRERLREAHRANRRNRGRSWSRAGFLRGVPVDPAGTPYTLDPATGRIVVRRDSPLWPLPTEPAAAPEMRAAAPSAPR